MYEIPHQGTDHAMYLVARDTLPLDTDSVAVALVPFLRSAVSRAPHLAVITPDEYLMCTICWSRDIDWADLHPRYWKIKEPV